MRFGAHYLPTHIPELDGTPSDFYRHMFEQMELLDRLGYASSKANDGGREARTRPGWQELPSSAPVDEPLPRRR